MSTIYFLDETNYVDLLQKYNDIQACVGIIVIDNYEELMQRATEEEKIKTYFWNREKDICLDK